MILNETQIRSYFYMAGFTGSALDAAVKISFCESSWNTDAWNTDGEDSRGLMQINVNAHPEYLNYNLFDPLINCKIAYQIYKAAGSNFRDWTCADKLGLIYPAQKKNNLLLFGSILLFPLFYLLTNK